MRILVNDVTILERSRLGLVRVANQIDRLFGRLDESPLYAARKSAPPRPRSPDVFTSLTMSSGFILNAFFSSAYPPSRK